MTNVVLGRLEQVALRTVWDSESSSFTPWLAKPENLALLSQTLNLDLEMQSRERSVGPFRADLLCRDTVADSWVLIENQLELTDHKHLGQLLTYAAGLATVTIIWIAESFTEEHRATLDWLNEITDERFRFFGLEMELWRIGNSPVAPKFNIISQPNDWVRTVAQAASGELTETRQIQLDYWTEFVKFLQKNGKLWLHANPRPSNTLTFAIGRNKFSLDTYANTRDLRIGVGLRLEGANARAHFVLLKQEQVAIERELGTAIAWQENQDQNRRLIILRRPGIDPTNRSEWSQQHAWLMETLDRFYKVFSNRVKAVDASDYIPVEDAT